MRVLFQGDSITAGGRGEAVGYPVYAQKAIIERYPFVEFEFVNRAVWGNRIFQLKDRLQTDVFDVKADLICLMIGVNNALNAEEKTPSDVFAKEYEALIREIKQQTNVPLFLIQPYLFNDEPMRNHNIPLLREYHTHIERVAKKYADGYLPLYEILSANTDKYDYQKMTVDGLHLSDQGAKLVGELCFERLIPFIDKLLSK